MEHVELFPDLNDMILPHFIEKHYQLNLSSLLNTVIHMQLHLITAELFLFSNTHITKDEQGYTKLPLSLAEAPHNLKITFIFHYRYIKMKKCWFRMLQIEIQWKISTTFLQITAVFVSHVLESDERQTKIIRRSQESTV